MTAFPSSFAPSFPPRHRSRSSTGTGCTWRSRSGKRRSSLRQTKSQEVKVHATPALPDSVAPFAGRINDIDSHEMIPAQVWIEVFGEAVRPWAERSLAASKRDGNFNELNAPDYVGDVLEIDPETVWTTAKGPLAPGASDM